MMTFERALAAAGSVLQQNGFDGFSMQAVADEADLAIGTLYQYFPDKYKLLRTLLERWYARSESRGDMWKSAAPDIDALVDIYLNEVGGTALMEAIQAVPELRHYDRMKMEAAVERAATALAGGAHPTPLQLARARVAVFAIDGVLREAARVSADEARKMIKTLKLWVEALYADAAR